MVRQTIVFVLICFSQNLFAADDWNVPEFSPMPELVISEDGERYFVDENGKRVGRITTREVPEKSSEETSPEKKKPKLTVIEGGKSEGIRHDDNNPLFMEKSKWSLLERVTQTPSIKVVVLAAGSSAAFMYLSRLLIASRGNPMVAASMVGMSPEVLSQFDRAMGIPDTYTILRHEKYGLDDLKDFVKQNSNRSRASLSSMNPEFVKYLLQVLESLKAQELHKLWEQGLLV